MSCVHVSIIIGLIRTHTFPPIIGIKFASGPDHWYDQEVSVVEMDGEFGNLDEVSYVEKFLGGAAAKYPGEITQQLLKNKGAPGSLNGSGLFQTVIALKIRQVYEKLTKKVIEPSVKAASAA